MPIFVAPDRGPQYLRTLAEVWNDEYVDNARAYAISCEACTYNLCRWECQCCPSRTYHTPDGTPMGVGLCDVCAETHATGVAHRVRSVLHLRFSLRPHYHKPSKNKEGQWVQAWCDYTHIDDD